MAACAVPLDLVAADTKAPPPGLLTTAWFALAAALAASACTGQSGQRGSAAVLPVVSGNGWWFWPGLSSLPRCPPPRPQPTRAVSAAALAWVASALAELAVVWGSGSGRGGGQLGGSWSVPGAHLIAGGRNSRGSAGMHSSPSQHRPGQQRGGGVRAPPKPTCSAFSTARARSASALTDRSSVLDVTRLQPPLAPSGDMPLCSSVQKLWALEAAQESADSVLTALHCRQGGIGGVAGAGGKGQGRQASSGWVTWSWGGRGARGAGRRARGGPGGWGLRGRPPSPPLTIAGVKVAAAAAWASRHRSRNAWVACLGAMAGAVAARAGGWSRGVAEGGAGISMGSLMRRRGRAWGYVGSRGGWGRPAGCRGNRQLLGSPARPPRTCPRPATPRRRPAPCLRLPHALPSVPSSQP
jgi:hypothetical protein